MIFASQCKVNKINKLYDNLRVNPSLLPMQNCEYAADTNYVNSTNANYTSAAKQKGMHRNRKL